MTAFNLSKYLKEHLGTVYQNITPYLIQTYLGSKCTWEDMNERRGYPSDDKTEEKFWHVWRKKSLSNWEKLNTQQKHNIWKSWEILFTNPILRYLDIEIIYWKLTCSNVSISNPPLSSRKSFPHFYFTPNYPASPPPIPQLLTPDHFLASQNMWGKFTIYLSFKFDKTLSKKTIF